MGEEREPRQEEPEPLQEPEDFAAFLEKRGAIPLLAVVDSDGRRYKEIEKRLTVSSSTLATRLGEAQDLSLMKRESGYRSGKNITVYLPTFIGQKLRTQMKKSGITKTYRQLQTYQEQFEKESQEFVEWVLDQDSIAHDIEVAFLAEEIYGGWDMPEFSPPEDDTYK